MRLHVFRPPSPLAFILGLVVILHPLWAHKSLAHEFSVNDLILHHPWARATAGGAHVGVVYLIIRNRGNEDDRLIGATSELADRVEIHQMTMAGSVMEMEELPALDIPRDKETVLAPNGAHLMLVGLKRPLKFGEHFPMVLTFEKSGTVEIDIEVQKVGDLEPAD